LNEETIGLKACDRDLIVAFHEAGHAVVCHRLGVGFGQVVIGEGAEGAGVDTEAVERPVQGANGAADYRTELERYAVRCRSQVVVAFAGRISEVRAARCGLTAAIGLGSARKDERDAHYFVREMINAQCEIASLKGAPAIAIEELPQMLVAELGALREEAEALVEAEFAKIEVVARQLAEKGRLTVADVERVCG